MSNTPRPWKNRKLIQFALLFCLVMLMYFVVEVLPLNVGVRHIPWHEIPMHIRNRLPVVVAIALVAAAMLVIKQRNPDGK